MRVVLIGFTVPDAMAAEISRTDAVLAAQTHRFAWGVVGALRGADIEVDVLSAAPVSDYPRNPRLVFRGGQFTERGVNGRLLPFINLLGLKHLTRWLSAWIIGGRYLSRAEPALLLVHGVHSPFLWYAVYARRRFGTKVCVLLTDPPGVVLPSDSGARRLLKYVDIGVTKLALARVDGVIVLAEPLATDFAPGVRSMTMEGLLDPTSWPERNPAPRQEAARFTITYAGGLSEEYGVGRLVRAVRASGDPDIRLQLLGRGSLEDWIREQSGEDNRILAPRLVDSADLGEIYARSDLLVQPRPTDLGFVRYSFPSKLMEYMASGVPVVSTRLSSIPVEYEDLLLWTGDSEASLRTTLEAAKALPKAHLDALGERGSDFVRNCRSIEAQGRRIRTFLASLGS